MSEDINEIDSSEKEISDSKNKNVEDESTSTGENKNTRNSLQLARRFFHFLGGVIIASLYAIFLNHKQVVYGIGLTACVIYVFEQVRITYPHVNKGQLLQKFYNFLYRAEEQVRESAAMPYIMAVLLTILSFPKRVALVAIYTLAISDPISAIVGIKFGKHKINDSKSWEGTIAFGLTNLTILLCVLGQFYVMDGKLIGACFLISVFCTAFETLPLKLDDNLTIPLFCASMTWLVLTLFGLSAGKPNEVFFAGWF